MEHLWAPVGTGVRPQEETDFITDYLFGEEQDREAVAEMDRHIEELPGLQGLHLFAKALVEAKARRAAAGLSGAH
jgi:hypothetical protein